MALFLTYTLRLHDKFNLEGAAAPSNHKTHAARQEGQSLGIQVVAFDVPCAGAAVVSCHACPSSHMLLLLYVRAGKGREGQGREGQGMAGQGRAGKGRAGQHT